jgi:hypothetical protein
MLIITCDIVVLAGCQWNAKSLNEKKSQNEIVRVRITAEDQSGSLMTETGKRPKIQSTKSTKGTKKIYNLEGLAVGPRRNDEV